MFEPLLPVNFLYRATRLFPDKLAVVDGERRYTYRALAARVNRLSNALRQMGVSQGDKVAVLSPNSHRMLEAFFAVPQLGAILTPLNYRLSSPEFAYILEHSETRVVLVDGEYAHQLAPIVDTLKGVGVLRACCAIPSHRRQRFQPTIMKRCWRPPVRSSRRRWKWLKPTSPP